MTYVFIINPCAGKGGFALQLQQEIESVFARHPEAACRIYHTQGPKDATRFVAEFQADDETCFVACGGDGTLSEVAAGAVGRPGCSVAVYPCGSGNDFIKNFGTQRQFCDLESLLAGSDTAVDLLQCGERYAVNLCNIGLDARVAQHMERFKRLPLVRGRAAYTLSLLYCLAGKLASPMRLVFDGGEAVTGEFLLAVAANGICYGGGYYAAPRARVDDGLIDFCGVSRVSRLVIAQLVRCYQRGEHLEDPRFSRYITLRRCRELEISSPHPLTVCLDGEIHSTHHLRIALRPAALRLRLPGAVCREAAAGEPLCASASV